MHETTREPASIGVPSEIRKLNADGQATVSELRDFLGQMRSRSPQEVLGLFAESHLFRCIAGSTVLFAVGMLILTVVPFLFGEGERKPKSPAPVATSNQPATPAETNGKSPAPPSNDPRANAGLAAEAMGINESKPADSSGNPLESSLDNLLDDIK